MRKFKQSEKIQKNCKVKEYHKPLLKKIGGVNKFTMGTTGLNSDVSGQANTPGIS